MVRRARIAGLCLVGLWVAGCTSFAGNLSGESAASGLRPVVVEDVRVEIGVGSPIPVDILVSGTWPDLCSQLAQFHQTIEGSQITVTLLATPLDPECPPDYLGVPFGIAIPINIVEMPEGNYTVEVNGVPAEFTWPPAD